MNCDKCSNSGYLSAMSVGKCKKCGKPTPTNHLPSHVICKECSKRLNLCEQCGEKI